VHVAGLVEICEAFTDVLDDLHAEKCDLC
jgi:hypothetical protein